jgi:hypothetical protein
MIESGANLQLVVKRGRRVMAKKDEGPAVHCYPAGLGDEFPHGPATAVIIHRGLKLVLRFDEGDFAGKGPVREIRLLPDTQPLDTAALRFMPGAAIYFHHARAAMATFGSTEGTAEERWARFSETLEPFRKVAGPGRGYSPRFYELLAEQYKALVAEGDPHPIKALAEIHHVKISTASKWMKEARRPERGLLDGEEAGDAR